MSGSTEGIERILTKINGIGTFQRIEMRWYNKTDKGKWYVSIWDSRWDHGMKLFSGPDLYRTLKDGLEELEKA